MDHAPFMSSLERTSHFGGNSDRLIDGELVIPVDPLPERLSFYEGHYVIEEAVSFPRIVKRQDVRVLQVGCGLDLC